MKKIMQSLTGVSEEDSERMLVELGRDPKAGDVKDKLKVRPFLEVGGQPGTGFGCSTGI